VGSVKIATHKPWNSDFHDGWRGITTLVPSVRITLLGSAINMGIVTPTRVRTRIPTCKFMSGSIAGGGVVKLTYVPLPTW
jgi:hypothetical protein